MGAERPSAFDVSRKGVERLRVLSGPVVHVRQPEIRQPSLRRFWSLAHPVTRGCRSACGRTAGPIPGYRISSRNDVDSGEPERSVMMSSVSPTASSVLLASVVESTNGNTAKEDLIGTLGRSRSDSSCNTNSVQTRLLNLIAPWRKGNFLEEHYIK